MREAPLSREAKTAIVQPLRTLQIIVINLAAGPLVFAAILVAMNQNAAGDPMLGYALLAVGVAALPSGLFLPPVVAAAQLRSRLSDSDLEGDELEPRVATEYLRVYSSKTIFAAALFEGGAFANLVGWMLTRSHFNFLAAAILSACIVALFPTLLRVEGWIGAQRRRRLEQKMMGGIR